MNGLPQPRGRQGHVVFLSQDEHHVVLGTAGTGKSTMAILRAIHLSLPTTQNNGPVLLVTYNNTLVTYLNYLGKGSPASVTVQTYGRFARGYLASLGLMGWNKIAQGPQLRHLVALAVAAARAAGHTSATLDRDLGWIEDEIHWISGMGIKTEADYQAVGRIGRKTAIGARARAAVWAVREQYRVLRAAEGRDYDWYDIATSVREAVATDTRPRMYKHIIIDEGQDLSPEAIRSLTEIVDPSGSVTFFGDYHQAIYGQGLSWRSSGINLGNRQVETFGDNYRNTQQIAAVAMAMAASEHMKSDDVDLVSPHAPNADGPKPTMVIAATRETEIKYLRDFIEDASVDQSVAVLARTWAEAASIVKGLEYTSMHRDLVWDGTPGIYIGTFHSAKGLEFDAVVLPFLDDATFPHKEVLAAFDEEEACAREARLLYVGMTRARSTLVMSHSGIVSRLLPDNDNLWDEVTA